MSFFDDLSELGEKLIAEMIIVKDFMNSIKDLRCWVKNFYD